MDISSEKSTKMTTKFKSNIFLFWRIQAKNHDQ